MKFILSLSSFNVKLPLSSSPSPAMKEYTCSVPFRSAVVSVPTIEPLGFVSSICAGLSEISFGI